MEHYICTGDCAGEAPKPGVCETEGCSKEGSQLTECTCDDGLHVGAKAVTAEDDLDVESMDDEDNL
jgi:hypothetical protein